MSRDRFLQILACLHLRNNQEQPARDLPQYKLFKLGNLPQLLNEVCAKRYKSNQNLSADEQIVGTRCRVQFIQYMPKKPTKFGLVCSVDIRKKMKNMHVKKHWTIVWNATNLYAKIALSCIILKVLQVNDNIHVWKCLEYFWYSFLFVFIIWYINKSLT